MLALVAAWAFAEAALFFLVADIPISVVAVRSGRRAACLAALVAAFAAATGGALLYLWAVRDPQAAASAVAALPGIAPRSIVDAAERYRAGPLAEMLRGSLAGTPFKLYALAAADQGTPLPAFALAAPLVRLPRFLLTALLASAISRALAPHLDLKRRLALLGGLWAAFYLAYFAVMPG